MKISTSELKEKLKIVKTAILPKSSNAALECALVRNGRIYGSNSLISISTPIDLDGEFLIPKRAMDIINCSHSADTEFSITEKSLTVKFGNATSRFPLLNTADYIDIPSAVKNEWCKLPEEKISLIDDVAYASALNDERPVYKSVLFDKEIVALDGVRAAVAKNGVDFRCIIPQIAFKAISLLKGDNIRFTQEKSKLFFDDDNIAISVSGISGEFMDYHKIIPELKYQFEINRDELLEKLEIVNVATASNVKQSLKIQIKSNQLTMITTDSDISFEDTMPIDADFEFELKINPKFLYDAVKSFKYDFVIKLSAPREPVVLENEEQLAVIVPML